MGKARQLLPWLAIVLLLAAGGIYWWQSGQPQVDLAGNRIAVLIGEGYYDSEATQPISYLRKAGAEVITVGPELGAVAGSQRGSVEVTHSLDELTAAEIDCLVIPGGSAPLTLREDPRVIALVQACAADDKLLAVVGRGARILIRAGLVADKEMTTWEDTKEELADAGAKLFDQPVVRDGNLLTTRGPSDLKRFCVAIADALAER